VRFLLEVAKGLYVEYLSQSGQVVGCHRVKDAMSFRYRLAAEDYVALNKKLLPTDVRVVAVDLTEHAVQQTKNLETREN